MFTILTEVFDKRTIIVIENIQWLDNETMGFLSYLVDNIVQCKFLLLLTISEDKTIFKNTNFNNLIIKFKNSYSKSVRFSELSSYSISKMPDLLKEILNKDVRFNEDLIKLLYEKSRGVPLFLKYFLEVLRDDNIIVEKENYYTCEKAINKLKLPDKLSDYLGEKLYEIYRAIKESRNLLENASVIGEKFNEDILSDIMNSPNIHSILRNIDDDYHIIKYLIQQSGNWIFSHITWMDFIYNTLGENSKKIHKKIANYYLKNNFIDYSKISYHYKNAHDNVNYNKCMIKHARELVISGQIRPAEK